jgi:Mg2+ and Co2+ transporter CorA
MERTVKQEAGQQHVDLLQEYNNVIEEFEKRYGILSDVQIRTQLKIRQVTGLRDGISTVTNVVDSQTALDDSKTTIRQGNNIRILTYITIAYLPLGFVTGLFSISHAPFMESAGNVAFALLVVFFVLGTYTLALSLENIIDQWSRLQKEQWSVRGLKKPHSQVIMRRPSSPLVCWAAVAG